MGDGFLRILISLAGYLSGLLVGSFLVGDSGFGQLCGIVVGVLIYFFWEKHDKGQRESRSEEEESRRTRTIKDAQELAHKYPEATKHYFETFWGINKKVILDSDITYERAEELLSMLYTYDNDELKYNPQYRRKVLEQREAELRCQETRREEERREAERKLREEEQALQRKEEERRNLATTLSASVASWSSHNNSSLKHKYYYEYYSYSIYKDDATSSMWDTWRTVWHFKNDSDKGVTSYEHDTALRKVTKLVEDTLRSTFGSKTEYLTLVCLTASTQRKTELRFKDFSERVCSDLKMANAYPHIQVVEDGSARHEGGDGERKVSYDRGFFKDRYVVLFDDVRTSGRSLEKERRTLEGFGAKVVCAITIAQTIH